MDVHPTFPENRLQDPKRQAELAVYRQLEASDAAGTALYEARPHRSGREIDFAIWLEDVARIAMQVKGGAYRVDRGTWYLATPTGEQKKPTPAKQTWDAALQLHDFLQDRIDRSKNPFVVPVLVFPDMDPDAYIEARSAQAGIQVLFGAERLVERLIELATTARVYFPPTAVEIAEEVALVIPGLGVPGAALPAMELAACQVIIQHAETVNVYTMGEMPDQSGPPADRTGPEPSLAQLRRWWSDQHGMLESYGG